MPAGPNSALAEHVESLRLVDHHVHGAFTAPLDRVRFGNALNEADTAPLTDPDTAWDSQLGFAVRRWCAEVLDLPPHVGPTDYLARRAVLGAEEVNRRLLTAAGVGDWLVDTGFGAGELLDPAGMAAASGADAYEVVRLETVAERVITTLGRPRDYADAFGAALAAVDAVGVKSVLAYRCGFDVDLSRPEPAGLERAVARWAEAPGRLVDPVIISYGLHLALERALPLQLHVGFGDHDLDLRRVDPLLLTDFLRTPAAQRAPILLLHCYPYERAAGYLAQAFPMVHLDVGLAVPFLGARSAAVIARSLELAPLAKVLYSSDAYGPAELHHLGARLWRNGLTATLQRWVDDGEWSAADAIRVATMIGTDNARRIYGLPA